MILHVTSMYFIGRHDIIIGIIMVRLLYSTLLVILCLQACSLLSVAHHYWWLSTRAVEGWSNSTGQHFSVRAYRKQEYHDGRQVVR